MSSIGPTDGPPAPLEGYSPQQLLYLQQQFANYYNQFQQDPSSANAQQLLQFMESNKGELQFLCQNFINLAPFPNPNFAFATACRSLFCMLKAELRSSFICIAF